MDSPRGCSRVSCVCGGERVAPALLVSPDGGPPPRGWLWAPPRGAPCPGNAHRAPAEERGSRVGPRPAQGHATTWAPPGWGGRPFPPSAPLTSRRLRSAGCSRKERLSRYCHRGLSSGGSRRFSRRSRREEHRLPAGGVLGQGLGSRAPGVSLSRCSPGDSGLCSRPARGTAAEGAASSFLLTQEKAGSEGSAQSSRSQGQRGGHREPRHGLDHGAGRGRWWQRHLCSGYRGRTRTLGPSCSALSPALPADRGLEHHLAAAQLSCKPCPREPVAIWWLRSELRPAGSKTCL